MQDTILWQLHPLTFVGAPPAAEMGAQEPRLLRLLPWLDHVIELGANALLLGPVFQSRTHGYDTSDHYRVDSRLGSEADLRQVLDGAHARGVRVVLDGVFNHVGRDFPALMDLEANGTASAYADWFRRRSNGALRVFEGHDILVELNHDEPAVADYVVDVMSHWLERGVDGWRLDAAYAMPDRFWSAVSQRVLDRHPQAWLFGEVIHGDYAAKVMAGGFHAVTQYELWKAVWSGLNDRNLFELAHALGRHDALLDTFVPQTFIGNHDVTRIASQLTDSRHLAHALVVLLTVAGSPSIYAGDELGWEAVKQDRLGGDDAVRPAFPGSPADVERGGAFRLHQELIAMRRRQPWVHGARLEVEHLANKALVYVSAADGRRLAVLLNLDDEPFPHELQPGAWRAEAGDAVDGRLQQLPPHGWAVLSS